MDKTVETQQKPPRKRKAKGKTKGKRRKQPERAPSEFEERELLSIVCDYICREALTAPKVTEKILRVHGVEMSREEPYAYFREAVKLGWITFTPPSHHTQRRKLEEMYPKLHDVSVVQTAVKEDVAQRGARMLLALLQRHFAGQTVHIGWSGGIGTRTVAHRFGELLRRPFEHLPKEIVFHSLVAGVDIHDPTTNPNSFFSYFVRDPTMTVQTSFVGLHAPALAGSGVATQLREHPGIKESYDLADEIQVIVTGASCWDDPHSALIRYPELAAELDESECVGDMIWQPLALDGPIELKSEFRANTLMGLDEVSARVAKDTRVLLVAGPCAECHRPKTQVVNAILKQERQLVTHLAVDSRCARELLA